MLVEMFANWREIKIVFTQNLRGESFSYMKKSKEKMFRGNLFARESVGFVCAAESASLLLLLSGKSTEAELALLLGSIFFHTSPKAFGEPKNVWDRVLSSRGNPRSKCSVSISGLPDCLASYVAEKITRRASSV